MMSIGFNALRKFRDIENMATELGFKFTQHDSYNSYDGDVVTLMAADNESLPIYSRNTSLFAGDIYEVEKFLLGWRKSIDYLKMIGATTSKTIQRKEQDIRNAALLHTLKIKSKRVEQ